MITLPLDNVWSFVKNVRILYLLENSNPECNRDNTLLSDREIQDIVNSLAGKLQINTTSFLSENISYQTLEMAGEMFTYLSYCPPSIPKLLRFRAFLFQTGTPRQILLALTSLIKTLENVNDKEESIKIFSKFMKSLDMIEYENIQIKTKQKCYTNATFGNCPMKSYKDDKETSGFSNKTLKRTSSLFVSGFSKNLQKVTNHPVHIIDQDNEMYPTAMIPFCEFGGNLSVMGVKISQFNAPVCNSFRPKIIRDQMCYTVDPNEYKNENDLKGELSLSLFIHYNEDRQMEDTDDTDSTDKHFIIETIGKMIDVQSYLN